MATRCLRYVAAYVFFDALFIIHSAAIRGAGDTRFAMWVGVAMAWGCFALPCYVIYRSGGTVWHLWTALVVYIVLAGTVYYLRYRSGAWQHMRVIEPLDGTDAAVTDSAGENANPTGPTHSILHCAPASDID
jgi:MATE family multidrug resistance protein